MAAVLLGVFFAVDAVAAAVLSRRLMRGKARPGSWAGLHYPALGVSENAWYAGQRSYGAWGLALAAAFAVHAAALLIVRPTGDALNGLLVGGLLLDVAILGFAVRRAVVVARENA